MYFSLVPIHLLFKLVLSIRGIKSLQREARYRFYHTKIFDEFLKFIWHFTKVPDIKVDGDSLDSESDMWRED